MENPIKMDDLGVPLSYKPCQLEIGGRYLHDSFSTLWEIKVFGFPPSY